MSHIFPQIDPDGLLEYSVVFTDRSLNHMSAQFQGVMRGLHDGLTEVYQAERMAIIPGGGSFAMEAVARQFSRNRSVLVIRNGWFSYRWSQIFEQGVSPSSVDLAIARPDTSATDQQFSPIPAEQVAERIRAERPQLVIAPHVETSAGLMLSDDYLSTVAQACKAVDALFVLDCVAAGAIWIDMAHLGVDVLITAPQKGWSSTPCAGLVMMSERAVQRLAETTSDSFALDLRKWHQIMDAYLAGGHAYHATLPTDGLHQLYRTHLEMREVGFQTLKEQQITLGTRVRALVESAGYKSLAAPGWQSPTVVVSHTDRDEISRGSAFAAAGVQVAAGVPLACGESAHFKTFRIGLFGLDKLTHIDRTVDQLSQALEAVAKSVSVGV